jgi:hypothetical protein
MTASEMTPADIAACTGNKSCEDGMWGGGWSSWIILFLIFGMFGYGGYGGFGGGFGGGYGGAGLQGMATRADINEGFALNNITSGIQAIQQGICDSTYALTNAVNTGFHGVDNAVCNLGYNVQAGFNAIGHQISDCCCTTQRAIDSVNYNMAKGFCDLGNVINNTTRDVIENQNANSRAILDFLTQDKIATLTAENQTLKFAASQSNQNAVLMAAMDANKAEILRRTGAECPTAAYLVQPPTPVNFPVNGCGQVQFGGYGGCGCGCGA